MSKQLTSKQWQNKQIEQQKKDLKSIDVIYVVGLRKSVNDQWDIGHWRHYMIYYVKDNKLEKVWFYEETKNKPKLWNQEYRCFETHVLGSNRAHEIVYSLYTHVYNGDASKGLHNMPRIEFLSDFDGDEEKQEEIEKENLEGLF